MILKTKVVSSTPLNDVDLVLIIPSILMQGYFQFHQRGIYNIPYSKLNKKVSAKSYGM